ncbi:MAG: fluoride efflux transporter CrcB [Thermomicrobiales bacterium]|nr:fluoride efflux transporter CrcB [Thermomicrobiales bacterium]
MVNILWIGIGGFLGANMRYWLGSLIGRWLGTGFPYATGIINITGAFTIGIIATLFADRAMDNESLRLFLIVGILGGYTTFSSYSYEAVTLMQEDRWLAAIGYLVGSNVIGISACVAGVLVARIWT